MSPRPPYRWKSFWLGILVLVLIAWEWLSTLDTMKGISFDSPLGWIAFIRYAGQAGVFFVDGASEWHMSVIDAHDVGSGPPNQNYWSAIIPHGIIIAPYWLWMLLFLLGWSAFLGWRWRRIHRLANLKPAP